MLELTNLTRSFGDNIAVDAVSFPVKPGRITGFVGGNGAGKTTTMRLIMGLLQPDSGEIFWDDAPITTATRRRFGYMPEERGLYPKQQVAAQLQYLGRLKGMSKNAAAEKVDHLLETFELIDRAGDNLEKLSLGNQQRAQICAALLGSPQALILDEPFNGLDPHAVDSTIELLQEHLDDGVPVLFSSHQLDLVERLADEVVILHEGQILATGTPEAIRSQGPNRFRLTTDTKATWLANMRGVEIITMTDTTAILELPHPGSLGVASEITIDQDQIIRSATEHGRVLAFEPLHPSLAEIYREVTA